MSNTLRLVHCTHLGHALRLPVVSVPLVVVVIVILTRLYPTLEVSLRLGR